MKAQTVPLHLVHHDEYDRHQLKMTGSVIVKVRPMTNDEKTLEGWEDNPATLTLLEYDNGAKLYPACERCDQPGEMYAMFEGERWKIEPMVEANERRPAPKVTPRWVYPLLISMALCVGASVIGIVAVLNVTRGQNEILQQQLRNQASAEAQRAEMRDNQRDLSRLVRHIEGAR